MQPLNKLFLLLMLQAWCAVAWSLPSDKDQPINITASSAERDEKKGTTIYRGHVEIHQGTVVITAETVIIQTSHAAANGQEKLETFTASGNPSHFEQQLDTRGNFVEANAETILYKVADKMIHLLGDATLKQQGSTITGDRIAYDIKAQRVNAKGSSQDQTAPGRVKVIIPAKKKTDAEHPPAPAN